MSERCQRHGCRNEQRDGFFAVGYAGMATSTIQYGTGKLELCPICYWLLQDWLTGSENSRLTLSAQQRESPPQGDGSVAFSLKQKGR